MKTILASLSLAYLVQSQVTSPEAPKPIVLDHAAKVKANADSSSCEKACAAIAEVIPQTFFLRREGDFKMWDRKQEECTPACRIEPSTPEHVSWIILAAATHQCHFAVRGGGHSRIKGSSNAEDGITIDLRRFNAVEVSKDQKTVKIGGGQIWGNVYKTLEKQGLAVVGGRVSDVGVGGLLLGGMCRSIHSQIIGILTAQAAYPFSPIAMAGLQIQSLLTKSYSQIAQSRPSRTSQTQIYSGLSVEVAIISAS
jgi:hypothetical protein